MHLLLILSFSLQQNKPLLVDSGSRNSIDTKIKTKRLRTYGEKRRRCGSDGFVTISYRNDSLLFRVNGKFHSKKLVQFSLLNEGDDLVQGGFLPKNGLLALALKGARVSAVAITVDGQKTKIPVSDIYNP